MSAFFVLRVLLLIRRVFWCMINRRMRLRTTGETPLPEEMGEAQRGGPSPARNVPTVGRICFAEDGI